MSDPVLPFLFVLCAFILWGIAGSSQVVHQPRYTPLANPSDHDLSWEPIRLTTRDHFSLAGWLIRHPRPEGTLLLLHGFGTCKADLLDVAKAFHKEGVYHLLLMDFRGHGASSGKVISFGLKEVFDVEAGLSFISNDSSFRKLPVGCYGISMGGAIGLLAAAAFPQIKAVVSDSAYADLGKAIARAQWLAYHIPRVPLGQLVLWATQARIHARLARMNPVHIVGRIAPRGTMIIHGTKDRSIPAQDAEALFQAAGEPKRLWLVPGAEHVASFYGQTQEYLSQVMGFYKDVFRRAA